MTYEKIIGHFAIQGKIEKTESIGSGHINRSFRLRNADPQCPDYLLQSINTQIFKDPLALTENIVKITRHLRSKYSEKEADTRTLTPVPGLTGEYCIKDENNTWWRMFIYIPESKVIEVVTSEKVACEAGRAFGTFLYHLADFPADEIHEVIPGFHDPIKRISDFKEAVKMNRAGRLSEVEKEVALLLSRTGEMTKIHRLASEGKLPRRVVHYDTKCSNILFDRHDNALCVIDLDTVMPGYLINDFGDSIRTFANTAAEDEPDLSKVHFNIDIFRSYAKGFLEATAAFITPAERENLVFAAQYLTYEQALRFLGDYLNGDVYYHIQHPLHNLHRARVQIKYLEELDKHCRQMKKMIDSF